MYLWHLTPDTPRSPHRVRPGDWVTLDIGSWPIEPGQGVWVDVGITHADGSAESQRIDAEWRHNAGDNSYWRAELPPFVRSDVVHYQLRGRSAAGGVEGPAASFRVGPKLHLAILWQDRKSVV